MFTITSRLLPYFKAFCSSAEVILLFVYMKCRFSLSYRDLKEMMDIRGAKIDHSTLQKIGRKICSSHRSRSKKKETTSW